MSTPKRRDKTRSSASKNKRKLAVDVQGKFIALTNLPKRLEGKKVALVWKKSESVKGVSQPQVVKDGQASFSDNFSFDASLFYESANAVPEPGDFEPKPLEFQVIAPETAEILAAARINLSEYSCEKEALNLRSELKSSNPSDNAFSMKFRLHVTKSASSSSSSSAKKKAGSSSLSPLPAISASVTSPSQGPLSDTPTSLPIVSPSTSSSSRQRQFRYDVRIAQLMLSSVSSKVIIKWNVTSQQGSTQPSQGELTSPIVAQQQQSTSIQQDVSFVATLAPRGKVAYSSLTFRLTTFSAGKGDVVGAQIGTADLEISPMPSDLTGQKTRVLKLTDGSAVEVIVQVKALESEEAVMSVLSRKTSLTPQPQSPVPAFQIGLLESDDDDDRNDMKNSSTYSVEGVTSDESRKLRQELEDLRLDNERLKGALEAQVAEVTTLSEEQEELRTDNARLKSALETVSAEHTAQVESMQRSLSEAAQKAQQVEQVVNARVAAIVAKAEDASRKAREKEVEVETLREKLVELERAEKEATTRTAEVERQLAETRNTVSVSEVSANEKLLAAQEKLQKVETNVEKISAMHGESQRQVLEMQSRAESAEQAVLDMGKNLKDVEVKLSKLVQAETTLQAQKSQLEEDLIEAQAAVAMYVTKFATAEDEANRLKAQLEEIQANKELSAKDASAQVADLQQQLKARDELIKEKTMALRTATDAVSEKNRAMEQIAMESQAHAAIVKSLETELANARNALKRAEQEAETAKSSATQRIQESDQKLEETMKLLNTTRAQLAESESKAKLHTERSVAAEKTLRANLTDAQKQMEDSLRDVQKKLEESEANRVKADAALVEVTRKLTQVEDDLKREQSATQHATAESKKLQSVINDLEHNLKQQQSSADKRAADLQAQVAEESRKIAQVESEKAKLQETLRGVQAKLVEAESHAGQQREALEKVSRSEAESRSKDQAQVKETQGKLEESEKQVKSLQVELADLRSKLGQVEASSEAGRKDDAEKLAKTKEKLAAAEKEVASRTEQLQSVLKEHDVKSKESEQRVQELQARVTQAEKVSMEVQAQFFEMTLQTEQLNKSLNKSKESEKALQTLVSELEGSKSELESKISDTKAKLGASEQQCVDLNAKLEASNKRVEEAEASLRKSLNDAQAQLEKSLRDAQGKLAEAEQQNRTLQGKITDLEAACLALKTSSAAEKERNTQLQEQVNALTQKEAQLDKQLGDTKAQLQRLEAKLTERDREVEEARNQVKAAVSKAEESSVGLARLRENSEKLEASSSSKITELQQQLEKATARCKELESKSSHADDALIISEKEQSRLRESLFEVEESFEKERETLKKQYEGNLKKTKDELEESFKKERESWKNKEEELASMQKKSKDGAVELQTLKSRITELSIALDLAKEQRAEEKERAQEAESRVEELSQQMEEEHSALRGKLVQTEKLLKETRAQSESAESQLKVAQRNVEQLEDQVKTLEQTKEKLNQTEKESSQYKGRVSELESSLDSRSKQVQQLENKLKESTADFARVMQRVAELEAAIAAKEEKTASELASMKRDLDKQAEGKTERLVREIMERNVYLCKNRDEWEKDGTPASSKQLYNELKPHVERQDMTVLEGIVRAAGDFCRLEGTSLNVLFHVAATFLGLSRLFKGTPFSKMCVTLVAKSILVSGVHNVVASWERGSSLSASNNTNNRKQKMSAVPILATAVTPVLRQAIEGMVSNKLPNVVIVSVCGSLMTQLNRFMFNTIVKNKMFCTFGGGMQLKVELSLILDFMYAAPQGTYLKTYTGALAHVTEASSLLTISKDILTDKGILDSAFPHLNPLQIRTIIAQYVPDPESGDHVSPHIIQYFDKNFKLSELVLDIPESVSNKYVDDCEAGLLAI